MYKHLCYYDEGQELALKYLWIVLQVASSVGHNTFIILYSHLDNTDGGEKSIYQYCKENTKLSVYSELREEGYPKELFTVSPKNVQHFELKVTRKLIEKLVADKMCGSLTDVLRIMKEFVNLRNDLCHLALQSLTVKEYKMKLQGMWENFHVMYRSACVLTKTEFPPHVTKELDTILSSLLKSSFKTKDGSKWKIDTKVKDNIKEDSHTRDTSQSSDDSGCYESAKSTNNNKWSSRENPAIEKLTRSQTKKSTTLNVKEKSVQTKAESKRTSKNVSTQVEGLNEAKETEGRTENNNNNSNTTVPASNKNKWTQVNLLEEVETLVAYAAVQNGNPQQDNLINRSLCWPSTSAAATQRSSDVCLDSGVEELPSWVHSNERPDGDDSNIDDEEEEEGYLREQQIPFYQHDTNSKKEKGEKSTRFASKIHSNGRPDGDDSNNDDDDGDEEYLRGQQIPFCRHDTNSKTEKKKKEKKEETKEKSSTSFNTSTNNEVNKRKFLLTLIKFITIYIISIYYFDSIFLFFILVIMFTPGQMVNKPKKIVDADTGQEQIPHVRQAKGTCILLSPCIYFVPVIPSRDCMNSRNRRRRFSRLHR